MPSGLSEFETAVLAWIACRSHDPALKEQIARAELADRHYTVVGCYSKLALPVGSPRSTESYASRGPVGGPHFESPAVEHGGGTLLWLADGRASELEVFVHGNYFPRDHADLGEFRLTDGA